MQTHLILRCEFYTGTGTGTCVIFSTRKDEQLGKLGIDAYHQLRGSQIRVIKRSDETQWVWLPPEEASGAQRATITTLLTINFALLGGLLSYGPLALVGGMIGFRLGLKYGGIGRAVSVVIESKCGKKAYIGTLPLWQAKKIAKILKSSKKVEFREAEGNTGS